MATMAQTEARLNGVVMPIWNAVRIQQNFHKGEFQRYVTISKSHFHPIIHKESDSPGQSDLHPNRAHITADTVFNTVSLDTFYPQITDNPIGVRIAFSKVLEPDGTEYLKMIANYVYEDNQGVRTGRETWISTDPDPDQNKDWFDNHFLLDELDAAGI